MPDLPTPGQTVTKIFGFTISGGGDGDEPPQRNRSIAGEDAAARHLQGPTLAASETTSGLSAAFV
jgi:hypothetical protein